MKFIFFKNLWKHRLLKTGIYCLAFILGFVVTSSLTRYAVYQEKIPKNIAIVSAKMEYFSKHKDEFDTIFLGSSQTYRQIVPSLFDEAMKAKGYEINSFNFGLTGLKLPEASFYLKKILAMQPKNLKWLFLEYLEGLDVNPQNFSTAREIYWHTPEKTLTVSRLIWESEDKLYPKKQLIFNNFMPFTYNILNSGKGSQFIQAFLDQKPKNKMDSLGNLKDGYLSLDDETGKGFSERHIRFIKNSEDYNKRVENLKRRTARFQPKPLRPYAAKVISQMIESLKSQGVETIFLMSPRLFPQETTIAAYQQGYIKTLFQFNNPNEFPSLYHPSKRFDIDHLNREGAKEFTKLLAQKFSQHLIQKQE